MKLKGAHRADGPRSHSATEHPRGGRFAMREGRRDGEYHPAVVGGKPTDWTEVLWGVTLGAGLSAAPKRFKWLHDIELAQLRGR